MMEDASNQFNIVHYDAVALASLVGERIDVALGRALDRPRTKAKALLEAGAVTLAGHSGPLRASYHLRAGDALAIRLDAGPGPSPHPSPLGEAIPLRILFEDEALLAIDKAAGLVVHPAVGHRAGTLVNALVHHCGAGLAERGGTERLGIVHRLDRDTSGVILVAKSDLAHERLAAAFAARQVRKIYRALGWGRFRQQAGSLRGAIGRHPVHRKKMAVRHSGGRVAQTDYRVLEQGIFGAEVECVLHTGRTHQIRVHLAQLGHAVWGDSLYGNRHGLKDDFFPARQMLHAAFLGIAHPLTGRALEFVAPLPEDFALARSRLLKG